MCKTPLIKHSFRRSALLCSLTIRLVLFLILRDVGVGNKWVRRVGHSVISPLQVSRLVRFIEVLYYKDLVYDWL